MGSDKRFAARRPVCIDIIVNHQLDSAGLWKTRDLSLNGAFVEMPADGLPPQSEVEAVLALSDRGRLDQHHVVARVVRTTADGVALAFGDYSSRTYTVLSLLLHTE